MLNPAVRQSGAAALDQLADTIAETIAERIEARIVRTVLDRFAEDAKQGVRLLYTEREAARLLNVRPSTLAAWRRAGAIGHVAQGKGASYALPHLLDYIARNEVKAGRSLFEYTAEIPVVGGPRLKLVQ